MEARWGGVASGDSDMKVFWHVLPLGAKVVTIAESRYNQPIFVKLSSIRKVVTKFAKVVTTHAQLCVLRGKTAHPRIRA